MRVLFHQPQFVWSRDASSSLDVRRRQEIAPRGSDSQRTAAFPRCLPSLFHRLHLDWAAERFSVLEVSRRQAALSVLGIVSTMLAIFISPITL